VVGTYVVVVKLTLLRSSLPKPVQIAKIICSHASPILRAFEQLRYCVLYSIESSKDSPPVMADEDLSDEQLHQLLKDAEQRLRNRGKQRPQVSSLATVQTKYARMPNHPPRIGRACY
jgi:hypothetical protein